MAAGGAPKAGAAPAAAPNENAGVGPAPGVVAGEPNANGGAAAPGVVGCELPNEKDGAAAPAPFDRVEPMAGAAEAALKLKLKPPDDPTAGEVGAGEPGAGEGDAPNVGNDVGAAPKPTVEAELVLVLVLKPNGFEAAAGVPNVKAAPGAAPVPLADEVCALKLKVGAAAGEVGAGEAGEAPKVNVGVGFGAEAALPKRPPPVEDDAPDAPNGAAASFLSDGADAPKLKPPDEVAGDAPKDDGAAPEPPAGPPNKNGEGAAGGLGGCGEPSSSMPESPASSVVAAGTGAAASPPPKSDSCAGAASFFSSACGVAGVVSNLNAGAAAAADVIAGVPKLKGDGAAGLSAAGVDAWAPKAKGEDDDDEAGLAAPNDENGDAAGASFFCKSESEEKSVSQGRDEERETG